MHFHLSLLKMEHWTSGLLPGVFALSFSLGFSAEAETTIPRWRPSDFSFLGPADAQNPFLIEFSAVVSGPEGQRFTAPGFYDGDGVWKIRVAPNREGAWSLETQSTEAALHGKRVSFECIANDNPRIHGVLLVDEKHPSHFIYEDGTRYFLSGYECDWLWAVDMTAPGTPILDAFLDKLASHGFNHILLNAYAHDTGWMKGKTSDDDYGPPPLFAWEGSNDAPDHTRMNLAYWRHYDRMMQALWTRGIVAHILLKVYNKQVKWPAPGSPEDDLFFRWTIARYAAFSNVVWDFSKEAQNEKDAEYKKGRLAYLRRNDPYRRLLTVHDDDAMYDSGQYDDLLDFRCDQEAADWGVKVLEHAQQKAWPVVDVEFGYEHGPKGPEDALFKGVRKGSQDPKEICRRAWEICLAGGYPAYYYTYTAWDVIRPQDTPPGYGYFRILREFFEQTSYWEMKPAEGLASDGWCLANPGKEYVVFLNDAKPVSLNVGGAQGELRAQWRHPFTGQIADGGAVANGTARLSPPGEWDQTPVALWVRPESQSQTARTPQ